MHRFFVGPDSIDGDSVSLQGDAARQISRVLRARPGQRIVVLDNSGSEYVVVVRSVSPREVSGTIESSGPSEGEPLVEITLFQSMLKADRFEFVLQKGTEMGVSTFVPLISERTVPRVGSKSRIEQRSRRWESIIREAAEQSHRGRLPGLRPPVDFKGACEEAEGLCLVPWEEERSVGLKSVVRDRRAELVQRPVVSVLVGPEGGFSRAEIELARAKGLTPVSLGTRILRSETAAVACVLYEMDDLGGK